MVPHEIILKRSAIADMDALREFHATRVADTLEKHLLHHPTKESKSRIKRLRGIKNPDYKLRGGEYRVFYLLQRSPRFRRMLDRAKRERESISLAEYRKSRRI